MTDQSPNDVFHASSFLQGANADYVERLYAKYADNPQAVDESWQDFFATLGDTGAEAKAEAAGPSWARLDWPPMPNDDLTARRSTGSGRPTARRRPTRSGPRPGRKPSS